MFINSNLKKKSLLSLSAVAAVALLSGCGADGTNGTDGNVDEVTITAVDGYIIGATVTDANGNTGFKNGDGTYSFVKAPKYPLSARGGTLLDTGESFTGTMYAAQGKVVSPLTTLLTTLDEDGNPTDTLNTATLDKLAAIAGVSADEISKDYMAEGNTAVAKLAQVVQIMNQDEDLMAEFKSNIDSSTATGGFASVKAIADTAIDKMTAQSKLSNIKAEVYKNILNDVEAFTSNDPATLEAELKDTKVALSNIAAIEVLGGEIGTDASALLTASVLVDIAGDPDSTATLSADQLTTLGASSVVTENEALTTMLSDIIKNGNSINSKAEVTAIAEHLENLYLLDSQADSEDDKRIAVQTAVEAILGVTIPDYQSYELSTAIITNSTLEADTYAKLEALVDGLTVINKPTLSVAIEADLKEALNGVGIDAGSTVATASATFDAEGKSDLKEFTLAQSGDYDKFTIDSSTGVITVNDAFDYEGQRSYTLTVEVTSKLASTSGDTSTDVASESSIITLNVVDVNDFGIQSVSLDLGSTDATSDDTVYITFNSDVETSGVTASDFTLGSTTFDSAATATYNAATKTYTISGGTAASALNDTINISNNVKQVDSNANPLVTSMRIEKFSLSGTSGYSGTFTDSKSVSYGVVQSPFTNKFWLDRNLGASAVATSATDAASYGDLYQWGRSNDGHEQITYTSSTAGTADNGNTATRSATITAPDNLFITNNSSPNDWTQNNTQDSTDVDDSGALRSAIWTDAYHANQVCPTGFRVPTEAELAAETTSALTPVTNSATAASSFLKLPAAGYRNRTNASLSLVGSLGLYWTSTVNGTNSRNLNFSATDAKFYSYNSRANGFTVRCLKN